MAGAGVAVRLVNTSTNDERHLLIQGGAFGEHAWIGVRDQTDGSDTAIAIDGPYVDIILGAGRQLDLRLDMQRYANQPSYKQPW